ncbi:MAG: helix-turn-helix domain-containing protein [Pararhodobacter sp.]|nr:helix-turn-helix domain-containing protein [Pararhodobacter sp.]
MQDLGNRSLDRGLTVLEVLTRPGPATLAELHRATGLPKSSLRRLLATLMARGVVHRSRQDGRYRSVVAMPGAGFQPGRGHEARFVTLAWPHMQALTLDIGWPSDLQVPRERAMLMIESARALTPYKLWQGRIGTLINMFGAASGRAWLAALPQAEALELHRRLADDPALGPGRFRMDEAAFLVMLAETRARGYALRQPGYGGEILAHDQLSALALPIRFQGRPVGTINTTWLRDSLTAPDFAARYLNRIRLCRDRIEAALTAAAATGPALPATPGDGGAGTTGRAQG